MSLLHDQKVSLKRQRFKCHNGHMKASCVCEFLVMQDHRVLLSILLLTKVGFEGPVTFYIKPALTTPSCARVGSASLLCAFFEPFAMDWALSILTNNCLFMHVCP